jgi:hypothetical protein
MWARGSVREGHGIEEESRLSINVLEMEAVILDVQAFQSTLRGGILPCSPTISEAGGTRSDTLCRFYVGPVSALFPPRDRADSASHPRENGTSLRMSFPGPKTVRTLHRDVVRPPVRMWDTHTVDLFTISCRTMKPWGWTACRPPGRASPLMRTPPPPTPPVPVLIKVASSHVRLCLVTPCWHTRPVGAPD